MSTTSEPGSKLTADATLQEQARRHLWMHFTRMGEYSDEHEIPIIVRGEGCYVYDEHGKRYLDGLASLFCSQLGHGRADLVKAGYEQAKDLGFFSSWGYTHPRAIELATKVAELAPGDLNRVFFTNSGSESVEAAIKLARQYHKITGSPNKVKVIAREIAYHGTTMGALAATGIPDYRQVFEPLTPGYSHVPAANVYRLPAGHDVSELAEHVANRSSSRVPIRSPR